MDTTLQNNLYEVNLVTLDLKIGLYVAQMTIATLLKHTRGNQEMIDDGRVGSDISPTTDRNTKKGRASSIIE